MLKRITFCLFISILIVSCKKSKTVVADPAPPASETLYFPPLTGSVWSSFTPAAVSWNQTALNDLYTYLQSRNTKAFIILRNGHIIAEKYFGTFTADSNWYWASAGKTMTAFLVGIARKEGLIDINNRSSIYLGRGWTSLPVLKEDQIKVINQLTMTTGLDDNVQPDNDCTDPSCLQYKADAGTRWAYHNAPYTLLDKVVENATGTTYNNYFQQKIRDRIGMNGLWIRTGYNNVYYSTARSMARFGLLLMNSGKWDQTPILDDLPYIISQTSSSQTLNLSYGYLTWLNGKASYMLPTTQFVFNGMLVPNAPADMFCALGKNDQKIYVAGSKGLVVVRMGDSAGQSNLALSSFDNELWGKLRLVIGY